MVQPHILRVPLARQAASRASREHTSTLLLRKAWALALRRSVCDGALKRCGHHGPCQANHAQQQSVLSTDLLCATTYLRVWPRLPKFPDWYLEADFLKDPPDPDPAKYWRDKKKKEIEERLAKGEKVEDWEYNGLEAEFGR